MDALNSWQTDGTFPLRSAVQSKPPSYSKPGFSIYDTSGLAGVDQHQLVYFSASIFWRASIKDWYLVETGPKLGLGPYEEQLRLFLLAKSDFPADAALVLSVSAENDVRASSMAIFPYYKNHDKDCRQYNFTMNGLTVDLFVGSPCLRRTAACASCGRRIIPCSWPPRWIPRWCRSSAA